MTETLALVITANCVMARHQIKSSRKPSLIRQIFTKSGQFTSTKMSGILFDDYLIVQERLER